MYSYFSDNVRRALELAIQATRRFNHEYIGTEHILLGVLKEPSGIAASVLKILDINSHTIHSAADG